MDMRVTCRVPKNGSFSIVPRRSFPNPPASSEATLILPINPPIIGIPSVTLDKNSLNFSEPVSVK